MKINDLLTENAAPFRWDGRFIHAGPWRLEPAGDAIAAIPPTGTKDAVNIYDQAKRKHYGRSDEIYLQQMDQYGIPKGLQPYIAAYLQGKATPEQIANHLASRLAGTKKESTMKMDELDNRLPDNFTIDDIKKMEKMTNIETMKAYAKELISRPSQRPMKPQKVAWFNKVIDSKRKPIDVIKLMYDLLLGGEGASVIGSRHSTDPNYYRKKFGEETESMSRAGKGVMKYGKDGMKALAKAGRDGASEEKLDKLRDKYDKYDEGVEPDHEARMAKGQLYNACKNAVALMKMIEDGENLEGWVAAKITKASDYLNSVHDYMVYEKNPMSEEKQRLDPKCWKGYRKQGTKMKGGVRVNNCVKVKK